MRRCAALLLLVSAALPGCGLTRTVWRNAIAREELGSVDSVVVSPTGNLSLRYSVTWYEPPGWGIGFREPSPGRQGALERFIVLTPSDMDQLLAREGRGAIAEVSGKELQKFVLSSSSLSGGLDGARVKFSREPDDVVAFGYPRPTRGRQGGEPRQAEEVTVRFHLPKGPIGKPPSVVVRVLLTPPAAIADAAFDAVVIVTAPVWLTIGVASWIEKQPWRFKIQLPPSMGSMARRPADGVPPGEAARVSWAEKGGVTCERRSGSA